MYKGSPEVTSFEFDLDKACETGLRILRFDAPDSEWARFVMRNRDINVEQPCHDYDIFSKVTSQYLFHSEAAIKMLRRL